MLKTLGGICRLTKHHLSIIQGRSNIEAIKSAVNMIDKNNSSCPAGDRTKISLELEIEGYDGLLDACGLADLVRAEFQGFCGNIGLNLLFLPKTSNANKPSSIAFNTKWNGFRPVLLKVADSARLRTVAISAESLQGLSYIITSLSNTSLTEFHWVLKACTPLRPRTYIGLSCMVRSPDHMPDVMPFLVLHPPLCISYCAVIGVSHIWLQVIVSRYFAKHLGYNNAKDCVEGLRSLLKPGYVGLCSRVVW